MRRLLLLCVAALGCDSSTSPLAAVPQTAVVKAPSLSAPVEVVRDQQGIPHIYGGSLPDVAWAQGYEMARDRLVQMDLARHAAAGTLAEIGGDLSASLIDSDLRMRVHHLRATAEQAFTVLQASADPVDREIVAALGRFADGVNAYLSALQNGDESLAPELAFAYSPADALPWSEVDSLAIGRLLAFQQSYVADGEILRSALDAAAAPWATSNDAALIARKDIAADLNDLRPIDPTYTLPSGWTGSDGTRAAADAADTAALALYNAVRPSLVGIGVDRVREPMRGSNNWAIAASRSTSGHALVASDPHLSLDNPATFWLVHLKAGGDRPLDVMGAAIPGVPGVVLGLNERIAWAATDSFLDACDVYRETIVTCDGGSGPCALFNGAKVALTPRTETIKIGRFGEILRSVDVTYYEVPHHGPILPRVTPDHGLEALGSTELAVKYTGYEVTQEIKALLGVDRARSVKEAVAAFDANFTFGGFNWMIGDSDGHIGWTTIIRVPRRAAGAVPWKVMPGDGSAEWTGDLDAKYIPHAYDPAAGFLATANADPIGVTDGNDPLGAAPVVDGAPLYIGAGDFDPGTRVGRIITRIGALDKLSLDDLQSIQADAVTEFGQRLAPTLLAAAQALAEELAQPGTHAELSALAATLDPTVAPLVAKLRADVQAWSFDTPSGTDGESPSAAQIVDSRATLVFNYWLARFIERALGDEIARLGVDPGETIKKRLIVTMCTHPERLATGVTAGGDPLLFDDVTTPAVESQQLIAAAAWAAALADLVVKLGADTTGWRWGRVHTLALAGLLPLDALRVPRADDPAFPDGGFPRHGDNGTVDVGDHGLDPFSFSYAHGPVQRFVAELTPSGPRARNALPGGETFAPSAPHYRDLMELWRRNQTFDVAFQDGDVVASALKEKTQNGGGRVHYTK